MIIAVVVLVLVIVLIFENKEKLKTATANNEKDMRKTNAVLERKTLDKNMKTGMTFDAAYTKTQDDMIKLGFDPCIPKDAYKINIADPFVVETSCTYYNAEEYDSQCVKNRRALYGNSDSIYADFPTGVSQMHRENALKNSIQTAMSPGTCFIYPEYGTVRIKYCDYSKIGGRNKTAEYVVEVLKTGETKRIRSDDPSIRYLGKY